MLLFLALCVWACAARTQIISTKSVEDDYILVPVASSKSMVHQVERVIWCFSMQENQRVDNCEEPGLYRVTLPHTHVTKRAPSTVAIKAEMLLNSKALERSLLEIHAVAINDNDEGEERFVEHVRFDSSVQLPLPTTRLQQTVPVATHAPETERLVQITSAAIHVEQTMPEATYAAEVKTHADIALWERYSGSGIFLFVGLGMVSLLAMLIHRVKYHSLRDNSDQEPEAAMVLKHPIMDEEEEDFVIISKEEQHDELQFLMQLGTGANPAFAQNL
jgi:hypothetical protein